MGHVSDFNGVNTCDETELSQVTSELISDDNLLDLNLNENFLPIYNSFPDDIYRQANLYASSNISSFINTDEENRNGYFDEHLELDLFFGSDHNFNIALDDSVPILENEETSILQRDVPNDFSAGPNINESNENVPQFEEGHPGSPKDVKRSHTDSYDVVKLGENHMNVVDNFEQTHPVEIKTYTAETVFKNSESSDVTGEPIPKIIIRLKPESRSPEQEFCPSECSAPMTIADNVKLGRRRNGNLKVDDSGQDLSKKVNKHKTHKRKSRHKKKQDISLQSKGILKRNQNCSVKLDNNNTVPYAEKSMFLDQNVISDEGKNDSEIHHFPSVDVNIKSNYQYSSDNTFSVNKSLFVNTNFHPCNNQHEFNNLENGAIKDDKESNQLSDVDSFQFDFEDASILPLSSLEVKKEMGSSVEEFLDNIDLPLVDENIPDLIKSEIEDVGSGKFISSSGNSLSCDIHMAEIPITSERENGDDNELVKSGSVSDLIEELNAHNQQVFEEIEISTPELELELSDGKSTTVCHVSKSSHPLLVSANDKATVQNVAEHGENDMNSQNHLSTNKTACSSTETVSAFNSMTNYSGTARPRNISSSSSSVTSKSSHRSYRKRRRSSSSSSSSSDREKFYNRPVKYDPVTDTYCDEFGREIRPNELKHYLDFKSSRHDSHSNNGSSSSSLSRSKSPRYRSYHRKHHKSRSSSRSHRRHQHSSSRSRSRSHGRKHKCDGDRKYRSPSPKHRSKRQHYLEVEENMKAYEERRVMYVGDIPPDYTVEQLKERFGRFGPVQAASIKSKFTSDGSLYIFGFVTFKNRSDVCDAIERGNENPSWPKFDLNFGGRRRFCNGNYTDLDGKVAEAESGWYCHRSFYRQQPVKKDDDFAELLRQEQKRLGMSKK